MPNKRLTNIILMSIEREIVSQMSFKDSFVDDVVNEFTTTEKKINFKYKNLYEFLIN